MLTIVAFIIVLGVLIFVHELGHFVTAKMAGIAVPRFSIGLGPKVWGVKVGETEYVLSALPLGGYVKMAGMGEDEALESLEGGSDDLDVPPERRFDSKSLPARAMVISAGVIMNLVFAIVAFAGIAFTRGVIVPLIGDVDEEGPAHEAGVLPGDLIVAVDAVEVPRWIDFVDRVRRRPGEELSLQVERSGELVQLTTHVEAVEEELNGQTVTIGRIGVALDTISSRVPIGIAASAAMGWRSTIGWSGLILDFLGGLFSGRESLRNLGGPILIGQLSGRAARAGVDSLVNFMAILSVNLAILNLLPIPILDGGHLVFLGIEAVRGRAVSIEARAKASQVGFIFILALMVWALTNDFLRITGN